MPFLAKLDLEGAKEPRRARRRIAEGLGALLVGHGSRFDIIIHNMSETGFLAEFSSDLQVGDEVRVQLARLGFVAARVVWKRGQGHGCEFLEPVPADVVEETVAGSHSFGDDPARREETERQIAQADLIGRRRRERRDRAGAVIMFACMMMAIAILAAALVRILRS